MWKECEVRLSRRDDYLSFADSRRKKFTCDL